MIFFPFHPSVLEPYFDLTLRKVQRMRNFHSAPAGQIAVVVKLLLQLQHLLSGIGCAGALEFSPRIRGIFSRKVGFLHPGVHHWVLAGGF